MKRITREQATVCEIDHRLEPLIRVEPGESFVLETQDAVIGLYCGKPLENAVRGAVCNLLELIREDYDFDIREAYMLIGTCPDVRINIYQMVDIPGMSYTAGVELAEMERQSDKLGKRVLDRYRVDVFLANLAVRCARWVENNSNPEPLSMEYQAVRIGDAVFVTFPNEIFSEIGLKVKQQSPFEKTFVIGLAGGHGGYIPTAAEYAQFWRDLFYLQEKK